MRGHLREGTGGGKPGRLSLLTARSPRSPAALYSQERSTSPRAPSTKEGLPKCLISPTPAQHLEVLRTAAIAHLVDHGERWVHELEIALVDQHGRVWRRAHHRQHVLLWYGRAGRVVWVGHDDEAGAGADGSQHGRGGEAALAREPRAENGLVLGQGCLGIPGGGGTVGWVGAGAEVGMKQEARHASA